MDCVGSLGSEVFAAKDGVNQVYNALARKPDYGNSTLARGCSQGYDRFFLV